MRPCLRHLLTAIFVFVATVPLLILGYWVEVTAMESEVESLSEKHLLLAKNVTAALDRYALDVETSFTFFSESLVAGESTNAFNILAKRIGFRHIGIIDNDGRVISFLTATDAAPNRIPEKLLGHGLINA